MLKPFITDQSSISDVVNFYTNQTNQYLCQMTQVINNNNIKCEQRYRELEKRVNAVGRKKRRSCTERRLVTDVSGEILLRTVYDDGFQEINAFVKNLSGMWKVNLIDLQTIDEPYEKYIITFPMTKIWVIGSRRHLSGNKLREAFIKAGVQFYPSISKSTIEDVLFQTFAPLIENCCSTIVFQELAGWHQNEFLYQEKLMYPRRMDLPKMPIQDKHFLTISNSREKVRGFFSLYRKIKKWEDRLYLLEIQILGIMASIFYEEGLTINFFLNLVFLENVPETILIKMLQIFNRNTFQGLRGDANEREIRDWLKGCNDEVIMVDANMTESNYKRKKIEMNIAAIARKICQRGNASLGIAKDITASLVIFNNRSMCLPGCINIVLGNESFGNIRELEKLLDDGVVESFLCEFICFAELNLQNIKYLIRQESTKNIKNEQKLLQAAFSIIKSFGDAQGWDIVQELNMPREIDFSNMLMTALSTEDMVGHCIRAIRKDIKHFTMIKRAYGKEFKGHACYYDETKIWIPTKVFDRLLGRNGLLPYKLDFLAAIKDTGGLCTDAEGLSTRLQIGQKRFEAYAFLRSTFDLPGTVDIVNLGKELCGNVI